MRFNSNTLSCLIALVLSASGSLLHADSLGGNGTGWQGWNDGSLVVGSTTGATTPYWNNASGDGPMANVGWCLTGGGNCSMPAGTPGALSFYGNGFASASKMFFASSGSPIDLTLQTVLTTQLSTAGGYDLFGYYLANESGSAGSGVTLNPLFDSRSDKPGSTRSISGLAPGTTYGFYIENIQGGGTADESDYVYLMDSSGNKSTGAMPADPLQHFAVFQGSYGSYFLGDVDDDACMGDFTTGTSPCVPSSQFDYNNMIVEVSTTPEPASWALLSAGLGVLATLVLRKQTRHSN